ncbi:hypothetical protein DRE_04144 [Drechslerella stenobrocha 248]|uniref:MYND-type domain-containing protein n=1 Tax=Drechslerella stenobrocha 248 TaxID=1043628 RepID=W7I2M4_9PEZI|nr:hypothetical protein DRE_04144 [Drechslerella stenobrocha 248]
MLHPSMLDAEGFFYPIGNTPAINLVSHLPPETDADVLLLGCGDVRHVLFTLFTESAPNAPTTGTNPARNYHFTACDIDGGVISRNILLLSLILTEDTIDTLWSIYYDVFVPDRVSNILKCRVDELLGYAKDLESWSNSPFGACLTIGSIRTLTIVKKFWSSWAGILGNKKREDQLSKTFKNGLRSIRQRKHGSGDNLSTARAAGPLVLYVTLASSAHFRHYWETGTSGKPSETTLRPNPTFGFSKFGSEFRLHYGTDPLAGFHLSTAFFPLNSEGTSRSASGLLGSLIKSRDFTPLISAAKQEFGIWIESFRAVHQANKCVLCFFVDDALELCASLDLHTKSSAHLTDIQALSASDALSKGYLYNHPKDWNVIDTSNLIDHVGIYNLILSTIPLLRQDYISYLQTETLLSHDFDPRHGEGALEKALGVDPQSLFLLLGIAPIDYLSGSTGATQIADSIITLSQEISHGRAAQIHGRLTWKHIAPFQQTGTNTLEIPRLPRFKFTYDANSMVSLLTSIYKRIFEGEDRYRMMRLLSTNPEALATQGLPHHTRATFTLVLQTIQRVTSSEVHWDALLETVIPTVTFRSGSTIASCLLQEQDSLNHLARIHTSEHLREDPIRAAKDIGRGIAVCNPLPTGPINKPTTCVTLSVPIAAFRKLLDRPLEEIGNPPLCLTLACGPLLNHFGSLRRSFGRLNPQGKSATPGLSVQNGSPIFQQDLAGWYGNECVLFSCIVPTWFLLLQDCIVSLNVVSTLQTSGIIDILGFNMELFRASLLETKKVRLSTHFPLAQPFGAAADMQSTNHGTWDGNITSDWLEDVKRFYKLEPVAYEEDTATPIDTCPNNLKLTFSPNSSAAVRRMIYRWDVSKEAKLMALLQNKAPVSTKRYSPSKFEISLGTESHETQFPYAVGDATKLSVARKSGYIELDAPLPSDYDASLYCRFPIGMSQKPPHIVISWNFHRINLDRSPPIPIDSRQNQLKHYEWINTTLTFSFTAEERRERDMLLSLGDGYSGNLLIDMKESIHTIVMRYAGLQSDRSWAFCLNNPKQGGGYMFVFVQNLRLDLSGQSIVADCALLPLELRTIENFGPLIANLQGKTKICQVKTSDSETQAWHHFGVSLVERCRNWSHQAKCEYSRNRRVPLSAPDYKMGISPICSCGKGLFPKSFYENTTLKPFLPHATRAVLGPLFPSPYIKKAQFFDNFLSERIRDIKVSKKQLGEAPKGACVTCQKSGSSDQGLLKCGRCKKREYCSKECQKIDWKTHKLACAPKPNS